MSVVVKNVGALAFTTSGNTNTARGAQFHGDAGSSTSGTVRVVVQGVEYVWGPNESKTLENGIAAAAVAASNSRLRIADTRDGADRGALRT